VFASVECIVTIRLDPSFAAALRRSRSGARRVCGHRARTSACVAHGEAGKHPPRGSRTKHHGEAAPAVSPVRPDGDRVHRCATAAYRASRLHRRHATELRSIRRVLAHR
jgi:hypothetical protein